MNHPIFFLQELQDFTIALLLQITFFCKCFLNTVMYMAVSEGGHRNPLMNLQIANWFLFLLLIILPCTRHKFPSMKSLLHCLEAPLLAQSCEQGLGGCQVHAIVCFHTPSP